MDSGPNWPSRVISPSPLIVVLSGTVNVAPTVIVTGFLPQLKVTTARPLAAATFNAS